MANSSSTLVFDNGVLFASLGGKTEHFTKNPVPLARGFSLIEAEQPENNLAYKDLAINHTSTLILDAMLQALVAVTVAVFAVLIATTMVSEPLVAGVVVLLAVLLSLGRSKAACGLAH